MPSKTLGLLKTTEDRSYPPDYLLARVRGRRARGEEGPSGRSTEDFRGEGPWLYGQMNRGLRILFAPVFEYFELRTWLLALRFLGAGEAGPVAGLLAPSLLAPPIQRALLRSRDFSAALAASDRILAQADPAFPGLLALYRSQGPGGLEQGATDGALLRTLQLPLHPDIRAFFRDLIDSRNLLGLYKHLHWKLSLPPTILDGGQLKRARLMALWQGGAIPPLMALARAFAGDPEATGSLEKILLDGVSRHLLRRARDPLGPGVILEYLWFCQTRVKNLGLRLRLVGGDEKLLAEELLA